MQTLQVSILVNATMPHSGTNAAHESAVYAELMPSENICQSVSFNSDHWTNNAKKAKFGVRMLPVSAIEIRALADKGDAPFSVTPQWTMPFALS